MALLDVHETKAGIARERSRGDELVREALQIVVAQHANARRKAAIEHRVMPPGQRLGAIVDVGPRVASRMRQLETDEQIGVGVRAESLAMRGHQLLAQAGDRRQVPRRDQQLMRIGSSVMTDRKRFAAPDQLRPARPEIAPSPPREIARLAVRRSIPALHRQDAEAIADADAVHLDRLRERRLRGRGQSIVELQRDARRRQMCAERGGGFERGDPRIRHPANPGPIVVMRWRSVDRRSTPSHRDSCG